MKKSPNNNGRKTDGTFTRGNTLGGRTKGASHRATLAVEVLLDGQLELLTQKAVEAALAVDLAAMRLCLERRISPPRKDQPVSFALPEMTSSNDAVNVRAQ